MPRKTRTRRIRRYDDLTVGQMCELGSGRPWGSGRTDDGRRTSAFASDEDRLRVWSQVRDEFLERWREAAQTAPAGHFQRNPPWAETALTLLLT